MAYTSEDVQTLVDLYSAEELQSRLRFLVEMRNKGISSDSYQGNQVVFRTRDDLTEEIRLYRAAWKTATTGAPATGSTRAFRILDGYGLRCEGNER